MSSVYIGIVNQIIYDYFKDNLIINNSFPNIFYISLNSNIEILPMQCYIRDEYYRLFKKGNEYKPIILFNKDEDLTIVYFILFRNIYWVNLSYLIKCQLIQYYLY